MNLKFTYFIKNVYLSITTRKKLFRDQFLATK